MTVLKAQQFQQEAKNTRAQLFNLSDIQAEADGILARARQEQERLLTEARTEIEQQREAARTEGFEQGKAQGLQQGREEGKAEAMAQAKTEFDSHTQQYLAACEKVCNEFTQAKAKILALAQQHTVALAVAMARRVIKQAGRLSSEIVAENVTAALDLLASKTDVVIRVHPDDLAHLEHMRNGQRGAWADTGHVRFVADDGIEPGGCVLITEHGQIDGTLDTQLDRIAAELLMGDCSNEQTVLAQPAETELHANTEPQTDDA